jgi:glycosyltransferase involved in cell wall biosynthesis
MSVERVAFLSSEYPAHVYGGLGTTVEALSRFLAAEGLEIILLVPEASAYAKPPPSVELYQIPVEGAVSDADYWLTYCQSARDTVRNTALHVDVVHCHDWMTALGGLAVGWAIQAPVLMSVHLPQVAATQLVLENIGIAGSSGVVVNSQSVQAELVRRKVTRRDISVIPNGVDLAQFSTSECPPNPQQILFVGRLVPQKGVDVLLRAFGAVLRRHPAATLVIAGDGQQRLYLERLARFLGIRQSVSFLGWQSPDELAKLYRDSAVIAVPSLYEPFGLVALEAMASGRPVVVSRVGGLAEIVDDGVSGFTVQAGDHLDLATRLSGLLTNRELAQAKGRAARHRAEQFDWAIIANRTALLYESLASQPNPEQMSSSTLKQILATADADLRERALALLLAEPTSRQSPPRAF